MRYAIAEEFNSIQGEGAEVGFWMHFIRLAGCPVGVLKGDVAICSTPLGHPFQCDTDFRSKYTASPEELVARCGDVVHVCITGGEPFLYDLKPLTDALNDIALNHIVHIETSGTRPIPEEIAMNCWITISPKYGFLPKNLTHASEVKLLVSTETGKEEVDGFAKLLADYEEWLPVFVQPVNNTQEVDPQNMSVALKILQEHPMWRLSVQLHKMLRMK